MYGVKGYQSSPHFNQITRLSQTLLVKDSEDYRIRVNRHTDMARDFVLLWVACVELILYTYLTI